MMEARRLEKLRRESAKIKAASQLPSSQEQEFNLRLLDLYREQPCLWNTSLAEQADADQRSRAWEKIAAKMGSHLSVDFVRCRIRSMRYKLNVYQLQLLDHQMTPGMGVAPEKPYFVDRFRFLDGDADDDSTEEPQGESVPKAQPDSPTVRGCLSHLWSRFLPKKPPLEPTQEAPPARRSGPRIANMVKERLENQLIPLEFDMPRLSASRQQRRPKMPGPSSSASSLALSATPPELRARPGESISVTKLARKRQQQQEADSEKPSTSRAAAQAAASRDTVQSEDEELYTLHWSMRKERRSLRPGNTPGQDQAQPVPARLRFSPASEPNPDIF